MILAIDPGNIESGYVFLDDNLKPVEHGKITNEELLEKIQSDYFLWREEHYKDQFMNREEIIKNEIHIAIEMIASYGMPVGKEVFDTCVWIGKFKQALIDGGYVDKDNEIQYIYRKDEKMNLCHSMKANDATIKQALVDRFAPGQKNYGKGTKKEPGWFYGFKADIWAAYAVGVTYYDMYLKGES